MFLVQLQKNAQGDGFAYSSSPEFFKTTLQLQFTLTLEKFRDIKDIEQKIMKHLYKNKKADRCIRVPVRPERSPDKKVFINNLVIDDENQWLYDLYEDMKQLLSNAVDPLNEYIKKFDPYKKVI